MPVARVSRFSARALSAFLAGRCWRSRVACGTRGARVERPVPTDVRTADQNVGNGVAKTAGVERSLGGLYLRGQPRAG
jgi:hypothetical protein